MSIGELKKVARVPVERVGPESGEARKSARDGTFGARKRLTWPAEFGTLEVVEVGVRGGDRDRSGGGMMLGCVRGGVGGAGVQDSSLRGCLRRRSVGLGWTCPERSFSSVSASDNRLFRGGGRVSRAGTFFACGVGKPCARGEPRPII